MAGIEDILSCVDILPLSHLIVHLQFYVGLLPRNNGKMWWRIFLAVVVLI